MFKITAAAALLIGAKAVSTNSRLTTVATTEDVADRDISFLSVIAAIPDSDPVAEQRTLTYWTGNEVCTDLFNRII